MKPGFKPMLAGKCTDPMLMNFPLLASPKLDGVRAVVDTRELLSRSLKPIPNVRVQNLLAGLPIGLDGELIMGDPTAPDAYRKTMSAVMADDAPIEGLVFWVFDRVGEGGFRARNAAAGQATKGRRGVSFLPHVEINDAEELLAYEAQCLADGYEGVMIRDPHGPYKNGRSTEREGWLLKLKRFSDSEAEVLDAYEQQHNDNEATRNALGRTERSTAQEGMVGAGVLGGLTVRDIHTGVEFGIGTGFNAPDREKLWPQRKRLVGLVIKYKFFPSGSKNKPRFPVFLGWRDRRDL